jgi:hypothetical protein
LLERSVNPASRGFCEFNQLFRGALQGESSPRNIKQVRGKGTPDQQRGVALVWEKESHLRYFLNRS